MQSHLILNFSSSQKINYKYDIFDPNGSEMNIQDQEKHHYDSIRPLMLK